MSDQVLLLLVEDEPLILLSAQADLEEGGYSVVPATIGGEAIALLDARQEELAGLITDVRLGEGPDGWEVARHARELKHDIPVVFITADSAVDWTVNGVPKSVVISKPFVAAQLVTAISTLLNESAPSVG